MLAADEALRAGAPVSFEEAMARELKELDLRATSPGWQRAVAERQLDDFESRHRAAARRGLRLLGTGRLGRVGPSSGDNLLLPATLAQSDILLFGRTFSQIREHFGFFMEFYSWYETFFISFMRFSQKKSLFSKISDYDLFWSTILEQSRLYILNIHRDPRSKNI